jgi:superfamily I DNA/RNA helicase
VTDPLREPGFLTEHQLRAVNAKGDIFLVACPGSGKTRAGGVRFARLTDEGRRVAATSYTNVGVEQIRDVVSGQLGMTVAPTSFVGTLHQFLLRYVFYPFGHLAMRCGTGPRLIADERGWDDVVFGGDRRIRAPVSRFHFRPDGTLCFRGELPKGVRSREEAATSEHEQALRMKRRYAAAGYASLDDSMYWSLEVLRQHPAVARAVAGRFDELQVDEGQDTSELQLACLHALCSTGRLGSLVLVGDIEQSIFSFQGASPEGCRALAEARGLETIELAENHRSSQRICDVAVHFCARDVPDRAVGEAAECPWVPELILYDPARPEDAVARFRERLGEFHIDEGDAAVLARANALVDELNGQQPPVRCEPRPLSLGRAAAAIRGAATLSRRQVDAVDRVLAYTAWDAADLSELEMDQRQAVRRASMAVLRAAPGLEGDLREWIRSTAGALATAVSGLTDTSAHKAGQALRSSADQEGVLAAAAFTLPPQALRAQTVHDLKGESRDAVLVVADRQRSRGRGAQGAIWSRPLLGEAVPAEDAEELRIAFVALTRARRYCAVALPADTESVITDAFDDTGFITARAIRAAPNDAA